MVNLVMVEDDIMFSRMFSKKFEEAGYKVHAYTNGVSALAAITKMKPTLVLCDIMMPKMNGLNLLEKMKANKGTKDIPFVFMTNLSRTNDDIEKGLELGAIAYLVKSQYTPNEIVAKVKEYISAYEDKAGTPEIAEELLKGAKGRS